MIKFFGLFLVLLWIHLTLLEYGITQNCDLDYYMMPSNYQAVMVNLTATSCFTCTERASSFSINNVMVTAPSAGVVIFNDITLVISNWTGYTVSLSVTNSVLCRQASDSLTRMTVFYTITPGPMILYNTEPFYMEGGSNILIRCVNPNQQPAYEGQTQRWFNSDGYVVGTDRTLVLQPVRSNAGNYTCRNPNLPIIPAVTFEVVVHYEVSESSSTITNTVNNENTRMMDFYDQSSMYSSINGIVVAVVVVTVSVLVIIFFVASVILIFRKEPAHLNNSNLKKKTLPVVDNYKKNRHEVKPDISEMYGVPHKTKTNKRM